MRVATLNLWGRSGAWPARRAALIAGLRELAPDVMAFQEAKDRDHVSDLLGRDYHVVHSGETAVASGRHGARPRAGAVALASKGDELDL